MAKNFIDFSQAISTMLSTAGLPLQPTVKQNYNPTGSLGSKKLGTSKYLDTVSKYKKSRSPTSSIATSTGNRSHATARSTRTWNTNKIPTEIDFSEDNFPIITNRNESPITFVTEQPIQVLPTNYLEAVSGPKRLQGSNDGGYGSPFQPVMRQVPSPYTIIDQTESSITIQSAISQALAEAREDHMKMITLQQEAHRKEIKTLMVSFQAQMKSLENNFHRNSQQPERIEFLEDKMERNSNQMDARLDKIIDLLMLNQGTNTGPSPFRKKTRHETSSDTNMEIDHFNKLTSGKQDSQERPTNQTPPTSSTTRIKSQVQGMETNRTTTPTPTTDKDTMQDTIPGDSRTSSPQTTHGEPPPLPDSPNHDDDAWLKLKSDTSIAYMEKAKTLLNPYRTAQETLKLNKKTNQTRHPNAPSNPMDVQLTSLSSSRSDKASRGREA